MGMGGFPRRICSARAHSPSRSFAILEGIAKRSGQPLGQVNKAVVAAGISCLLEKSRLDLKVFAEENVEMLERVAAGKTRLHGLLEQG